MDGIRVNVDTVVVLTGGQERLIIVVVVVVVVGTCIVCKEDTDEENVRGDEQGEDENICDGHSL